MIPKIPTPRSLDELTRFVNDRVERIVAEFTKPWKASSDVDMAGFRLTNVGAPKDSTDAARLADANSRTISSTIVAWRDVVASLVGRAVEVLSLTAKGVNAFLSVTTSAGVEKFKADDHGAIAAVSIALKPSGSDVAGLAVQNSGGTALFQVDENGNISKLAAMVVGLLIKTDTGFIQLKSAAGTTLFEVDATGKITTAAYSALPKGLVITGDGSHAPLIIYSSGAAEVAKFDEAGYSWFQKVAVSTEITLTPVTAAAGARFTAAGKLEAGPAPDVAQAGVYPGGATCALAKITAGGTDGSQTFNADGQLTAYTAPT